MPGKFVGLDKITQELGDFSFSEFRVLREIRFFEVPIDGELRQYIDFVIDTEYRTANYRLSLRFFDVSSATVKSLGGGLTRILGLDIVDLSERGWENVAWEVMDYDANRLNLYCRSIEVLDLSPIAG